MDLQVLALPIFALLMLTEVVLTALQGREVYQWRDLAASMSQHAAQPPARQRRFRKNDKEELWL